MIRGGSESGARGEREGERSVRGRRAQSSDGSATGRSAMEMTRMTVSAVVIVATVLAGVGPAGAQDGESLATSFLSGQ